MRNKSRRWRGRVKRSARHNMKTPRLVSGSRGLLKFSGRLSGHPHSLNEFIIIKTVLGVQEPGPLWLVLLRINLENKAVGHMNWIWQSMRMNVYRHFLNFIS